MSELFERATKQKLRFATARGNITTEDLWDLPLTGADVSLDNVAKMINQGLKASEEESFVVTKTKANTQLNLAMDITKHIIAVRLQEQEDRENAAARKERKSKILEILAKKEDDALEGKSVAALKKELAEL